MPVYNGTMRVGRRIIFASMGVAVAAGSALQRPPAGADRQGAFGWDGRAGLTLDQVRPVPRLKAPATQPATDRPPVEALELYGKSRDATLRGDSQKAIEYLQRAIAIDPYRFAPLRPRLGVRECQQW